MGQSNQNRIFDYIKKRAYNENQQKNILTTKTIADALDMQRPNVSTILNRLVNEGKLVKTTTRPVQYSLAEGLTTMNTFENLIGYGGSLQDQIKQAKAAVLYPAGCLNIKILAEAGTGMSVFTKEIINFAKQNQVIKSNSPKIVVDCQKYLNSNLELDEILFGTTKSSINTCFHKAYGGVILIEHYECLTIEQKTRLNNLLDPQGTLSQYLKVNKFQKPLIILACTLPESTTIDDKFPITIQLPNLKERPLLEKLSLINHFFSMEGHISHCTIKVPTLVLKALLLSSYKHNVKELLSTVRVACANAYVRVITENKSTMTICLDDLTSKVQESLLNTRHNSLDLDNLFGGVEKIIYDVDGSANGIQPTLVTEDLYDYINFQYALLVKKGISPNHLKDLASEHMQKILNSFNYHDSLDTIEGYQRLAKLVNPKIISIIQEWLHDCQRQLDKTFENSVYYGLCLHINSLLTTRIKQNSINPNQVKKLIQEYPDEYQATVKLIQILDTQLNIKLPHEESALIIMFLISSNHPVKQGRPVLLYILHGTGAAKSLAETTNVLNQTHYATGYDMDLNKDTKTALQEIKTLINKINQGPGVIVIYDMGSIKIMLDMISNEIKVPIRAVQIPITLIGIDTARKCSLDTNIDNVFHLVTTEINQVIKDKQRKPQIIITLCHTGEGGAKQLKNYIDQYSKLAIPVTALAVSDKTKLIKSIQDIQKIYHIHALVGTYDPNLFGIPFIPINKVFEHSQIDLDNLLMFQPILSQQFAYDQIYAYFEEQFKYASISKLKRVLPEIIDDLTVIYTLSKEQQIGLFVHLGSLIERIQRGDELVLYKKQKINNEFSSDYKKIASILKRLEQTFHIIIPDEEITTIVTIIKQL
ncbi:PRD domain-containing protein [Lactiplantibacillus nangangensis]|uniref:PRD domain-containing protein n=1 Tax=Lactiplantibacillus nangangensis TaxID=2559917 RepID=A0ABW1SG23_9LACO|nr:PRD domain-containing protein [Lactiplantibacillus nangangensis]